MPSSAAPHLVSGTGQCPMEDIHGVEHHCVKMKKLSGCMEHEDQVLVPSNPNWFKFYNKEIRIKHNISSFSPLLEFNLNDARKRLAIARDRSEVGIEVGIEHLKLTDLDFRTGVISSKQGIGG